MSDIVKTFVVGGTLSGDGGNYERECRVRATRKEIYVDEDDAPVNVQYFDTAVIDSDTFPDGDYEVEYIGGRLLLTKKGGHYLAKQSPIR